jgi:CheY-like chemotaxis protein
VIVSLVEDDPTVLELLAELLRHHGHDPRPVQIVTGDTIAGALDRLTEIGAPVVLMDLGMPIPGYDLLEAARNDARFRDTRFIIATASFEAQKEAPPGVRIVSKPYDLPELLAALAG